MRSSPAWAACLRVSGRSGIIGKLAHVACVAVGNATLDSTTLVNARLSGATADPATPTYPVACALPTIGKRSHFRITTLDLTEEEAALLLKQLNGIIDGTITSSQTAPAMSRRVPNYRVSALLPLDAAVHGVQLRSQLVTPTSFEKIRVSDDDREI